MTTRSGNVGSAGEDSVPATHRTQVPVAGTEDQATRLLLLMRLVALLNDASPSDMSEALVAGLSADLVDRLRTLRLIDAADFAAGDCGIFLTVDGSLMEQRLVRLDRARTDRSLFEHFIRRGASPQLVGRLFSISQAEVRTARRLIAPATATGGRPRQPAEQLRNEIIVRWLDLLNGAHGERERYFQLSTAFPDLPIVALEAVIGG